MKPCIASFFAGTAFVACLALANGSPARASQLATRQTSVDE